MKTLKEIKSHFNKKYPDQGVIYIRGKVKPIHTAQEIWDYDTKFRRSHKGAAVVVEKQKDGTYKHEFWAE